MTVKMTAFATAKNVVKKHMVATQKNATTATLALMSVRMKNNM